MVYRAIAPFTSQTVSIDLFEIVAPSDAVIQFLSLYAGQISEFGDAAAEILKLQMIRGFTTSGSGGSSVTPTPAHKGFPAAGATVEANNTTLANTGATVTNHEDAFNLQAGYNLRDLPEEFQFLSPGDRMVFRIAAPADATTFGGTLVYAELGG